MTKEKCKALLPIMQAWVDGEPLQVNTGGQWEDIYGNTNVSWVGAPGSYRIKPPDLTEVWVLHRNEAGRLPTPIHVFVTKERAEAYCRCFLAPADRERFFIAKFTKTKEG